MNELISRYIVLRTVELITDNNILVYYRIGNREDSDIRGEGNSAMPKARPELCMVLKSQVQGGNFVFS